MKKFFLFTVILFSGISFVQAQKAKAVSLKTETFEVNGNCGMCKKTIEKAAKSA
ncbi:MAG: hypothetical protein JNM68_10355, partial [Dinghuibacter sp.]|nr:hypothetical protein [Dinghuibacter sp.]